MPGNHKRLLRALSLEIWGIPDFTGQGPAGVSRNEIDPDLRKIYFEHNLINQSLLDLSIYEHALNKMNRS